MDRPARISPEQRLALARAERRLADPDFQQQVRSANLAVDRAQALGLNLVAALRQAFATTAAALERVDWTRIAIALAEYQQLVPENLRGPNLFRALEQDGTDGIPVAWVPRSDIVQLLLVSGDTYEERIQVIVAHPGLVVEDCEQLLGEIEAEAAEHVLGAIAALKDGHPGPAQSHAANVIDSVILDAFPGDGRREAVRVGTTPLLSDELTVRAVIDKVVMAPLGSAFVQWYPGKSSDPPPQAFARHATAHAAHLGTFSEDRALVAVMLATSLVCHFHRGLTVAQTSVVEGSGDEQFQGRS